MSILHFAYTHLIAKITNKNYEEGKTKFIANLNQGQVKIIINHTGIKVSLKKT